MQNIIDQDFVNKGIPSNLQPFYLVMMLPQSSEIYPAIQALWEAIHRIHPVLRNPTQIKIILSKSPFNIALNSGTLIYEPLQETVNSCIENLVFIDLEKTLSYQELEIQVICILEELVHVAMNVSDEQLVKHIVALLYPGVIVNSNGNYEVNPQLHEIIDPSINPSF